MPIWSFFGGALVLEAARKLGGEQVKKLAIYEVPYNDDHEAKLAWRAYIQQLTELLAANRRGDAVALFMQYVGMPAEQIEGMHHILLKLGLIGRSDIFFWHWFMGTFRFYHCAVLDKRNMRKKWYTT